MTRRRHRTARRPAEGGTAKPGPPPQGAENAKTQTPGRAEASPKAAPARRRRVYLVPVLVAGAVAAAAAVLALRRAGDPRPEDILAAYRPQTAYPDLTIRYPLDGTLFPPEIAAPTFRWADSQSGADAWLIVLDFAGGADRLSFLSRADRWTPDPTAWEAVKKRSLETDATATVLGVNRSDPGRILCRGRVTFRTSGDEVGAPLFYREVNLPFIEAVKDPTQIRWRFGPVSSPTPPPVVLEKLPVCGNCHSFSADGRTLAMDVDYANSKGSYVITRIAEEMVLATSDIITWNDYRKEDMEQTFGLLSQISPDGKVVLSTVKDKSVFVPRPDLAFSQLFFPLKGIVVGYYRDAGEFRSVPGADDPRYVQSNPTWSPDGRHVVFARSLAYDLKHTKGEGKVLLRPEECQEFTRDGKPFLFDLYRVPFNDGKGGQPQPIEGASGNGMSNFFPRYSPDGKWIVFCKARSYMLLQPDSELYIIPAEGGEARRMRCNTRRMNSWHSWSPNGRWLVFSSKAESDYTQLWLTHIDSGGESTPPVLLSRLCEPGRAANIPEFVNAPPTAIRRIREQFINDQSYVRAGIEYYKAGEADSAVANFRKALELNPGNSQAHQRLGFLLYNITNKPQEGMAHMLEALRLDPHNAPAHYDVGMALLHQRELDQAIQHLSEAIRLMPRGISKQYDDAEMRRSLGKALAHKGDFAAAEVVLAEAARLEPGHAEGRYLLAVALAAQGRLADAETHYAEAMRIRPEIDSSAAFHYFRATGYANIGQYRRAIPCAEKAIAIARAAGRQDLVEEAARLLELCRQQAGQGQ